MVALQTLKRKIKEDMVNNGHTPRRWRHSRQGWYLGKRMRGADESDVVFCDSCGATARLINYVFADEARSAVNIECEKAQQIANLEDLRDMRQKAYDSSKKYHFLEYLMEKSG